jgi:uncharacterized protein (UPF0333 family)
METLLILGAILLLVVGISIYFTKSGKVEDKNNNMIPDKVEEKVAQVKQTTKNVANETKNRAKRVVQESKDVARAAKEVVKQSKDIVDAAKGGKRKGRKKSNNQNKGKN